MALSLRLIVLCIAVLFFAGQAQAATFMGLGDLPGGDFFSRAHDVSADGSVVVGYSDSTTGQEAFRWTESDDMVGLGYLQGGNKSSANGVSADGSVVVGDGSSTSHSSQAFRWTQSSGMVGLDDPRVAISDANDLSADGSVVVGAFDGKFPWTGFYGFRWTQNSGMVIIGDEINALGVSADGSVIVGYYVWADVEAIRWTQNDGRVRLCGGGEWSRCRLESRAKGVSADGSVVVGHFCYASFRDVTAFRWTQSSGMIDLGILPGYENSTANDVSADGSIVVGRSYSYNENGWPDNEAFIWDEANGIQNLADVLTDNGVDLTGWILKEATGISADGKTIVGWGRNSEGKEEAWIADIRASNLPDLYVDGDIAVSGNGTSWSEAFKTIQEAIAAADDGDRIWVKQGTYFLSSTIDVDKSVAIYGGFDGTETQKSERNWRTHVTTVDGQDAARCFFLTDDATIDGFTIAHGQTNYGGGGMLISRSAPVITNCTFSENKAGTNGGGAIHNWKATPTITNNIFMENDGGSNGGGAIFNWDCPAVTVTNCTFSKNDGGSRGGGAIYNYNSSAFVTNCILWNDSADAGSEVYNEAGTLTIGHCDIAGGMAGVVNAGGGTINNDGTNIKADPLFAAAYHLQADSECIDKGSNSAPELPSIDIDGEARVQGKNCDIGVDEFHDTDGDGMPDWWEAIYGLDDPDDDDDRDGLSNLEEYEIGTNPNDPDSDGDGAGDGAETGLGTDPTDPSQTPECPISYYVSPAGDNSNSCLFPGAPCKTIQHALDIAYGTETCPVTIHVAAGTYKEHLVMDSWESLEGGWNSDFTQQRDFENNGLEPDPAYAAIIDGENNGTCLTLNNIEGVTVEGFTIQNGSGKSVYQDHTEVGGGAFCLNSSVRFKHTTFFGNTAEYGLVLYNVNSLVDISECVFKSNNIFGVNHGVSGVIDHVGGTLRISKSDFIENWYEFGFIGIWNRSNRSEFVGCRFIGNGGAYSGPALLNEYTSALIINCLFERNWNGGVIRNENSNPYIINCLFVNNVGYDSCAAAIRNWESSPEIVNCTFVDNQSCTDTPDPNYAGSIRNYTNSSPTITNSIFWQYPQSYEPFLPPPLFIVNDDSSTATVTFSNIDQDGYAGQNGNIRQDPIFYDIGWDDNGRWLGGDYHLQQGSPSIDAGDNAALPPDTIDLDNDGDTTEPIPLDLDGRPRIIDGTVDMGVYEYDGCPNDPNKTEPGICGCGTPDTDSDGDGEADCNDNCPNDPNKTEPGVCGCGIADTDTDSDGDGMTDCWEKQIIDADANDNITGIYDVLPGDDFDSDGWSNIKEYVRGTDPTNPKSHSSKAMPWIPLLLFD